MTPRTCASCGKGIRSGYTTGDGDGPWCSEACMPADVRADFHDPDWDEDDPYTFWTTWEDGQ